MYSVDDIVKSKKQLLPTGRAFYAKNGGNFDKLLRGLAAEEAEAVNKSIGLLNSIIPDNEYFTEEDCAAWENTLSISASLLDSIENRKAAIYRKMQFPSNTKGRQHKNYLEGQLRAANFDVRIYEYSDIKNNFSSTVHSQDVDHSFTTVHGGWEIPSYTGIIANFLDETLETPVPPTIENLKNIFWIAGASFGQYANIPPYRIEEFRNIVLTIKPLHTVAFLRVTNLDNWILATGKWNMSGFYYNEALWKY